MNRACQQRPRQNMHAVMPADPVWSGDGLVQENVCGLHLELAGLAVSP